MNRKAIGLAAIIILLLASASLAYFYLSKYSATTSPARVSGPVIFGVDGSVLNSTTINVPKTYGIKWMRFDVNLDSSFESYASNLSAANYSILGILDYQTMCDTANSSSINCNWTLSDWNQSVAKAVSTFPYIHYWEIYNQPQISSFDSGFYNGSPYNYYLMLASAYRIIKANNASDSVICLGGANLYEGGPDWSLPDYEWTSALWNYGASNYCDAISLHAYSSAELLTQQAQGSSQTIAQIFNYSIGQYENLTGKPIWITETGLPSNNPPGYELNLSNSNQAKFLNQTFGLFSSKPYVKAIFWFHLVGTVKPPYDLDYGLFYPNMTPKPSAYAFEKAAK